MRRSRRIISQVTSVADRVRSLQGYGPEEQRAFLENDGWNLLLEWIRQTFSAKNTVLLHSILSLMKELSSYSNLVMLVQEEETIPIISTLESIILTEMSRQEMERVAVGGVQTWQLCADLLSTWELTLSQNESSLEDKDNEEENQMPLMEGDVKCEISFVEGEEEIEMKWDPEQFMTTGEEDERRQALLYEPPVDIEWPLKVRDPECDLVIKSTTSLSTTTTVTEPPKPKRNTNDRPSKTLKLKEDKKKERSLDGAIRRVKERMKERAERTKQAKPLALEDATPPLFKRRVHSGGVEQDSLEDSAAAAETVEMELSGTSNADTDKTIETDAMKRRNKAKVFVSEKSRGEGMVEEMEKSVLAYPLRKKNVARILPTRHDLSVPAAISIMKKGRKSLSCKLASAPPSQDVVSAPPALPPSSEAAKPATCFFGLPPFICVILPPSQVDPPPQEPQFTQDPPLQLVHFPTDMGKTSLYNPWNNPWDFSSDRNDKGPLFSYSQLSDHHIRSGFCQF